MINKIVVSVVMPAYNAREYISSSIKSVIYQSFVDIELLVVDDCSTDDTAEIVERFCAEDSRVSLIRLPRNYGAPAGPRNVGVRAAKGEWIAFIDADDIWHPKKLACQMSALASTGAHFCSSQMVNFKNEEKIIFKYTDCFQIERVGFFKQLIKFRTPTSSVVVKRDLILRNLFNENPAFKAREDLDCWLHCHEEIVESIKVKQQLVGYRIIAGQISGQKWKMLGRHFYVLSEYRFRSGRKLGPGAFIFTISHFLFSLYYRVFKKSL